MGKIDIVSFRTDSHEQNIERKYYFFLNHDELQRVYSLLSVSDPGQVCFNYGYGKQPKSVYQNLEANEKEDYKILWSGTPKFKIVDFKMLLIRIFSSLVASTFGLIEIRNPEKITPLMNELSSLSMVGFFSFCLSNKSTFEEDFFNNITNVAYVPESSVIRNTDFSIL